MIYHPESASPSGSVNGDSPHRDLLFGEIDCSSSAGSSGGNGSSARSLFSQYSRCNLTVSASSTFSRFWLLDEARELVLEHLDTGDKARMRLVCHDFSRRVAPALFGHLHINFKAASFTRPARLAALARVSHAIHTCTFSMPHTDETALPPLIDPVTGEEQTFVYTPQLHTRSDQAGAAKFGSWDMASLLVRQYPPVFHAATNVPSFVNFFSALPHLRHIQVSCPSPDGALHPPQGNVVDYALISLRIAIERAPLQRLDTLSFLPIHPQGLFYLQPLMGAASSPRSVRRWSQITAMTVHLQSFASDTSPVRRDHLRTLHAYLRNFASSVRVFNFRWQGVKGPSPLTLETEPCFSRDGVNLADEPGYAQAERHQQQEPQKQHNYTLRALRFAALNHMELENAVMDAAQVNAFICSHKGTLEEFKFEQVRLRTRDWDRALSPMAAKYDVKSSKKHAPPPSEESMDVPLVLSPANLDDEELVDLQLPNNGSDDSPEARLARTRAKRPQRPSSNSFVSWLARAKSAGRAVRAREHLHNLKHSVLQWR